MELREFKKWLIDNELASDELYQESIRCYQVEAYRAAYIFSYLANHKYISKLAINYRGVPSNFKSDCPKEDVRQKNWKSHIDSLQNEDEWEQKVNDILIKADEDNIFKLPIKIKDKYSHMRILRNNAAHAKDRPITESTVLELWNDITYLFPYFVVNGTVEAWLDELDKLVKYSDKIEHANNMLDKFYNLSSKNQILIIKEILNQYIIGNDWDEEYPNIVVKILGNILNKNEFKFKDELYLELSDRECLYICILTGSFVFQKKISAFTSFEEEVEQYSFRYLCDEFADNFWKFIDKISSDINEQTLACSIYDFLESNPKTLLNSDIGRSRYLLENSFLELVLKKVNALYYYTMISTGSKQHETPTFDYSKFESYITDIFYLFYRISLNPDLKDRTKIKDFITRCHTLVNTDYSGKRFYSELGMQKKVKDINQRYNILKIDSNEEL